MSAGCSISKESPSARGIIVPSHRCVDSDVEATVRPSLSLYNTKDDIDRLADAIKRIQRS